MADPLIQVANAITDQVNADPLGNFGVDFTAVLSFAEWSMKLKTLGELRVDVVPAGYLVNEMADRGGNMRYVCAVHIGFRQRLRVDQATKLFDFDDVAKLIELTRTVSDWFASDGSQVPLSLTSVTEASFIDFEGSNRSRILETCDKEMLRVDSQYTGIIQVLYEVIQQPA